MALAKTRKCEQIITALLGEPALREADDNTCNDVDAGRDSPSCLVSFRSISLVRKTAWIDSEELIFEKSLFCSAYTYKVNGVFVKRFFSL